jgi:hypothetical protein
MSGNSNVGNSQVYEAGDQRTVPDSVIEEQKKENRFHEGKDNSHLANDSSKSLYPVSAFSTVLAILDLHFVIASQRFIQTWINKQTEDERSIKNKLEREEKREKEGDNELSREDKLSKQDATAPARVHGNEPSKGAKIDQELREEEEEELKRKGKA